MSRERSFRARSALPRSPQPVVTRRLLIGAAPVVLGLAWLARDKWLSAPTSRIAAVGRKGSAADLLVRETGYDSWALDATTTTIAKAVARRTAQGHVTESSIGNVATHPSAWPSKRVVDSNGAKVKSPSGEVPYDYSRGERTIKIVLADAFQILAADSIAAPTTIYAEFYVEPADDVKPAEAIENLLTWDTTAPDYATVVKAASSYPAVAYAGGGLPFTVQISDETLPTGRLLYKIAIRSKSAGAAISINGRAEILQPQSSALSAFSKLRIQPNLDRATIYLKKLVMTSRDVGPDELSTWQAGVAPYPDPRFLAGAVVAQYGEDTGTAMVRIPSALTLSEKDDKILFLAFYGQRFVTPSPLLHEAPTRLRCRRLEYDRATRTLKRLGSASTVFQNPRWAKGLGHSTTPAPLMLNSGRIVVLFDDEVGTSGDSGAPDAQRYLKSIYSDDLGATWSKPVTLLTASVGNWRVLGSPNIVYFGDPDSPYSGRHVAAIYEAGNVVRLVYSTDGFVTNCTAGKAVSVPLGYEVSETTIALRPDGVIVATARVDADPGGTGNNVRVWMVSHDGGESLTWGGQQTGASGQPVQSTLAEMSVTPNEEGQGRLIQGGPSDPAGRYGYEFQEVNGQTGALSGHYRPLTRGAVGAATPVGYGQLVPIDGSEALWIYEIGPHGGRTDLYSINAAVLGLHDLQ